MGVDFHWVGTTISRGGSHNGFGTIVSFPSSVANPPAGTILSTQTGVTYPIANGGAGIVPFGSTVYPSQDCDVYVKANGTGGSYYDWANAFNIVYKSNGTYIASETGNTVVNIGGTYYQTGTYSNDYYHDGSGGSYSSGSTSYFDYGTFITSIPYQTEVPTGSASYYNNGTTNDYYNDNNGGYYSSSGGAFYSTGTFIFNDGTYDYWWDGYGGYYI